MDTLYLPEHDAFLRYLDRAGAGPACVCLAGLGLAATASFVHVLDQPAMAGPRALLVDLLGCGYSDRPADFDYTIESHADTVAALLDSLELVGCILVGHSLGGSVALSLAARRPELVGRLVLLEANLDPGGGMISRAVAEQSEEWFVAEGYHQIVRDLHQVAAQGDASSAIAVGMLQVAAPHALHRSAASLVEGTRPTWRDILYSLSISRTYVFGEQSLPDEDVHELPTHGVQVLIVDSAGHGLVWDNPAGVGELLGQLRG